MCCFRRVQCAFLALNPEPRDFWWNPETLGQTRRVDNPGHDTEHVCTTCIIAAGWWWQNVSVSWLYRHRGFSLGLMMRLRVRLHSRKPFKHGGIPMLQNQHSMPPPVCILSSHYYFFCMCLCWAFSVLIQRCRLFAYGPADATASQNLIISYFI